MNENFQLTDNLSPVAKQLERLMDLALGCQAKEVEDLSDEERVALAWCAGCEMQTVLQERTDDTMRFRYSTKNPIGIVKIDGKFRVAELAPSRGDQIRL